MITVVGYDPAWPQRFEALRQEYVAAFARAGVPVMTIEHVGSTSVPGLAAKPVIDCDIVIAGTVLAVPGLSEAERRLIDSAQVPPIPPGGR